MTDPRRNWRADKAIAAALLITLSGCASFWNGQTPSQRSLHGWSQEHLCLDWSWGRQNQLFADEAVRRGDVRPEMVDKVRRGYATADMNATEVYYATCKAHFG